MEDNHEIDISIIIPFLNEEDNIPFLTESLNEFCSKRKQLSFEVIFVDDGSEDNSIELLAKLKYEYYNAKLIKLSKTFGAHAALRAGILNCNASYVTFFNADLQDPIELIDVLNQNMQKGYDLVWAVREKTNVNFFEKVFSSLYAILMRKFVSEAFPDKGLDIVMFNNKVRNMLNQNIENNSSIFLQIITSGFNQGSISYQKKRRNIGKSKWTLSKKIKLLIDSFVGFSYMPIRLVSIVGIFFFIIGIIGIIYIVFRTIIFKDLVQGWPMLISILLLGFGITNIGMGIIAEYLWRTLDASRNRPVFIIDKIIDL